MSFIPKQRWIRWTLGPLLAAGALFRGVECGQNYFWKKNQEAKFGTVEQPLFAPTANVTVSDNFKNIERGYCVDEILSTFADTLSEETELLAQHFAKGTVAVQAAREQSASPDALDAILKKHHSLINYHASLTESWNDYADSRRELAKAKVQLNKESEAAFDLEIDVAPDSVMKELFTQLTGKQYPPIHFVQEEQKPDRTGSHNPLSGIISTKGIKTVDELNTLLHETGHMITQHTEKHLWKGIEKKGMFGPVYDIQRLEEACAYAFVDLAASKLAEKNPDLAYMLKVEFEYELRALNAQKFYEGKDDNAHFQGAALVIAARNQLKDPRAVFMTLATAKDSLIANLPKPILAQLKADKTEAMHYTKASARFEETKTQELRNYNSFVLEANLAKKYSLQAREKGLLQFDK